MVKKYRLTLILVILLAGLSVVSLFIGVIDINLASLLSGDLETWEIFLISRLPRLLAILCTGVGMSVSGLIMQQLCMNKFVSPTTGATISSAQLGILLATQALSSWLVGHFSLVLRGRYELVYLVVPMVILAFLFANHFNIVGMGRDFSKNLGVPYNLVLFSGLTIAALITASVVVVVGSISYIGLIVPNVVAMFKGDKIRGTLVDTALFGAVFVLICDMAGRVVIAPYELPIELIIGILGSILFVALLFYRLRHGRKAIHLAGAGSSCSCSRPSLLKEEMDS